MKLQTLSKAIALASAGILGMGVLGGCAAQQTSAVTEAQSENRAYMTQVNQTMETLKDRLASFSDAVSRGDVVNMRTQADNAFKALDSSNSQDAPDSLKDIKQQYVDGCADLETALSDYVTLYAEIDSATDTQPFDWSSYDERLAAIQSSYDSGIAKLEAGDKAAADLNG